MADDLEETSELRAGDIGILTGLSSTITGIEVCVDSGCTTTSIPEEIASLFPVTKVLEEKPDRKLFITGIDIDRLDSTETVAMTARKSV